MGHSQGRVVEFNLHVKNVGDAGACDLCHVLRRPDTTSDRNSTGHPRHIHQESPVSQDSVCSRRSPQVAPVSQSRRPTLSGQRPTLSNLRPLTDFHFTVSLTSSTASVTQSFVTSVPGCTSSGSCNRRNNVFASES